uniref:Uncharacterized protein n=1 Tax=Triticum urartu TaxID=4572 RepID=A0A8R7PNQ9_TRIUA
MGKSTRATKPTPNTGSNIHHPSIQHQNTHRSRSYTSRNREET